MTSPVRYRFQLVRALLFFLLACAYMLVFFHRMAPGAVADDLMGAFGTTGASLGTLAATYFLVYSFMQIPSGVLADTLGMRYSMILGNAAAGAGAILFGVADSFAEACIGRLFVGLGVSVIFISFLKFNSLWFSERRFALLAGIVGLAGNIGAVLSAGPLTVVLGFYSWRAVFVAVGVLSLAISAVSLALVRNRPEDYRFPPVGGAHDARVDGSPDHWLNGLWAILKNPRIWPGFWSNFGVLGSAYAFMGLWGIPYLKDGHGMTRAQAASCVTVMLFASAFGALFAGWISDRIGLRRPVLVTGNIIYAVALAAAAFLHLSAGPMTYALFALLGFSCTGSVLSLTCAKEVAALSRAGMATSVVNTGTFLGTLILQPVFGRVLDFMWDGAVADGVRVYAPGDYRWGMAVLVASALIGVAGSFRIHETRCRNIYGETDSAEPLQP